MSSSTQPKLELRHHKWKCYQLILRCTRGKLTMKIYLHLMTVHHLRLLDSWNKSMLLGMRVIIYGIKLVLMSVHLSRSCVVGSSRL
nr:hypothetical protein Iba_chr02fCG5580 [Ipomoea batatas]